MVIHQIALQHLLPFARAGLRQGRRRSAPRRLMACVAVIAGLAAPCTKCHAQAGSVATPAPARADRHRIVVAYRRAADVFEILDQVSAWWPDYVEPQYRESWMRSGLPRPQDSAYFAAYAALRARHVDRSGQQGNAPRIENGGLFTTASTLTADPVATAFHRSETIEEALQRLEATLAADEISFLRSFYRYFDDRTGPLSADTELRSSASREATAHSLADTAVAAYTDRVARLLSARPAPDGAVRDDTTLVALYVWWPDSAQTMASPNGRMLILRVRPRAGEITDNADVVVHEAVHVLLAMMPEARKEAVSRAFLAGCHPPGTTRRLAILEEPLATVLGNIEFRRRFMPRRFSWSRSWYGDAWVDLYARVLHPLVSQRLDAGDGALDDALVQQAVALCTSITRVRDLK